MTLKVFLLWMMILFVAFCQVKKDTDNNQQTPEPPVNNPSLPSSLVQPGDLEYEGAFRLPDSGSADVVQSWSWGGFAMTCRPDGDAAGPQDGYPGSIFATGHAWQHRISEINIPAPFVSVSKNINELKIVATLQPFRDIFKVGHLEMPRVGLEFMEKQGQQTSPKIYLCWGAHLVDGPHLTHAWCETDLSAPNHQGDWYINTSHQEYNTNQYLFAVPQGWADTYTGGKSLFSGRFRDGGWSGQGPAIFAIAPWQDGNPPVSGQSLSQLTLLKYTSTADNEIIVHTMNNYQHSDEWSGAAWIGAGDKAAVIFVGTKGVGECWYGDQNGPCLDCQGQRGWWSTQFEGQIIFYNPADLAEVAAGKKQAWEPQPYAVLKIDSLLYHIRSNQQWTHVGATAFDFEHNFLYVMEPLADDDKPLVHVWKIKAD